MRPINSAYPAIEGHGIIGDRRTAALVANDGTLDWLCQDRFDGPPLMGALLDAERGGFWRWGPQDRTSGLQQYLEHSAVMVTRWQSADRDLELTDFMAQPQDVRPLGAAGDCQVLRRMRCLKGKGSVTMAIAICPDFSMVGPGQGEAGTLCWLAGSHLISLWSSFPLLCNAEGASVTVDIEEGETLWAVLGQDESEGWTPQRASAVLEEVLAYWRQRDEALQICEPGARRSAMLLHLLTYAPTGAMVAAPTTSLPERVGGDLNYDYRYTWIRDASIGAAALCDLGDLQGVQRFLDWVCELPPAAHAPLQVVYRVDGNPDLPQSERKDLAGYRNSTPVRFGNRAYHQSQVGANGFLADALLLYLDRGGNWKAAYGPMLERLAQDASRRWRQADSGIWELPQQAQFVSSKVMAWVTLDRAVRIAQRQHLAMDTRGWRATMEAIQQEVAERGWSEDLQCFRQRYDVDSLDAASLLIPVMGFLPSAHPRVMATLTRIEQVLGATGFVYRFEPLKTPGIEPLPLGQFEGAFLPCTFWLAMARVLDGHSERADEILAKARAVAGDLGIFSEEVDVQQHCLLGNTPLLFSQALFLRAMLVLARRPQGASAPGR